MSCSCGSMSNTELLAKIKKYQDAIEESALGEGVAVIQGEGRRVEFTGRDLSKLDAMLRDLITEACSRGLMTRTGGGAIAVEIG